MTSSIPKMTPPQVPEIYSFDFECEDCTSSLEMQKYKECPSCTAKVVKTSGCDHITCVCDAHWCYRCGGESLGYLKLL